MFHSTIILKNRGGQIVVTLKCGKCQARTEWAPFRRALPSSLACLNCQAVEDSEEELPAGLHSAFRTREAIGPSVLRIPEPTG